MYGETNGQPVQFKLGVSLGKMKLQPGPKNVRPFLFIVILAKYIKKAWAVFVSSIFIPVFFGYVAQYVEVRYEQHSYVI